MKTIFRGICVLALMLTTQFAKAQFCQPNSGLCGNQTAQTMFAPATNNMNDITSLMAGIQALQMQLTALTSSSGSGSAGLTAGGLTGSAMPFSSLGSLYQLGMLQPGMNSNIQTPMFRAAQ